MSVFFQTEENCWDYLFQMRWPDGFVCPRCKSEEHWLTGK
ncbi:MAG: transposase, partial [Draconibacterium sp.]